MSHAADDPALRRAIDDECLRLTYAHLGSVTAATLLMVLVLAAIMSRYLGMPVLLGWVAAYAAVSLPRLALALWYRRRPRGGDELRRRLPWLVLGLMLAPLAWSALPLMTPRGETTALLIQLMFAAGLIAGGAQTLIGTPRILFANTLLTVAPLTACLLTSGIEEQVTWARWRSSTTCARCISAGATWR